MPLDADQLDAFWMVVQQGGFHKAADALFITQSAVTQRVKALEASLGQALFVRSPRGATLTPVGQRLVRYCRERREAEEALLATLSGESGELAGRFVLGAATVAGRIWALPCLVELGQAHPGLDLSLVLGDDLDPLALLTTSAVDGVLSEMPVRRQGIRSRQLGAIAYALVARPSVTEGWPDTPSWAQLSSLRAVDFNPADRVTLDHLALCLPGQDLAGLMRYYVNDDAGILEWVRAGGGFGVLPMPMVEAEIAAGSLRRLYPEVVSERPLYLSYAEGVAPAAIAALETGLRARIHSPQKNLASKGIVVISSELSHE